MSDPFMAPGSKWLSRRAFLGQIAGLAVGLAHGPARAQSSPALRLRRGGSIHSLLNWPDLEPGSRDKFAWPPFSAQKFRPNAPLLTLLKNAGLDFIRLTIDPGPFLATEGARRDELDAILLNRIRVIHDAGLNVIADFHPVSQVAAWTPERITTDARLFTSYVAMIARTATILRAINPARIALEFMNEPPHGYDAASAARWQSMLQQMHGAARNANPALTLILSGAAGGGIFGLKNVNASLFDDPNTYWSFHYYSPHAFTHQGVVTSQSNMLHFRYLTDLPYPADASQAVFTEQSIRQAILADKTLSAVQRTQMEGAAADAVRKYFASKANAAAIAADFAEIAKWAASHSIAKDRIFLGEFGAARRNAHGNGALNRHRENWLHDVRTEAENSGFAWALWDIDDNQMGLVTGKGSGVLDAAIVKALGLKG